LSSCSPTDPSPDAGRGLVEIASANREWLSAWEDVRIEAEKCTGMDALRRTVAGFRPYGG
jgi:hypothetical protein